MSLAAGTRLGPYEILAPLGTGGMGEVYRARDARLDRTVAIKILPAHVLDHPTRRQRFDRESRAASRLSHPHICALYDVGQQDDVHFIVMELLVGETLAERLKTGALPIKDALRYAIEITDALDHAHRQGIIHRDLKPANIMLTAMGAKLLDFGLARFQASGAAALAAQPTESISSDGAVIGTLHYMAPEQLEGREADARTDIFALGAVLYEMLAGQQPFASDSTASVIAAILNREPPSLVTVRLSSAAAGERAPLSPLLAHVVSRCLAKNPDERWQTAADLREELRWIADGGADVPLTSRADRRRLRSARLAGAAVIAAVVIGGGAFITSRIDWRGRETGAAPPTFTQLTFRRGNVTQARFAPDGQTIFYSAAWDGGAVQVFETRANGQGSRPIGPAQAGVESVSSTNELALILGCELDGAFCTGTLARMPVSGGAAREVLDNVANADWAPDGRDLAVIHVVEGESRLEFPIGKRLYATAGKLQWVAFSPGGDRLAFIEHPIIAEESGDLKVVDLDGRVTAISTGWKAIRGLRWSPNGREIWFTGSQKGRNSSLYAVTLTGKLRLVLEAPNDITLYDMTRDGRLLLSNGAPRGRMIWASGDRERDLSWLDWSTFADLSADGKTLLFHEWGEGVGANPVVYTRDTSGADAKRLGDGKALALSPDGQWTLALLEEGAQLMLLPTGVGESRRIRTQGIADVYWAKWFPDAPPRRILLVASGADSVPRSYVLDIENDQLKQFADDGALAVLVSPDAQRLLVRDPLGSYSLWPLDGGPPARVEGIRPEDRPIQWSPDGRSVYLREEGQPTLRIHRFSLDTARRTLWRELAPRDPAGVIGLATGRGEVSITPDGASVAYTYWVLLDALFLVTLP